MRKKGFTLIELIIVVVIGVFIFGIVLSALGDFTQTDHNSRKTHDIDTAKDTIIRELENEIKWAEEVKVNPNNIQIGPGADKTIYRIQNGVLTKQNGPDKTDITTDKVIVEEFEAYDYSASTEYALVEVRIKISHANEVPNKVETVFTTTIAQRKNTI